MKQKKQVHRACPISISDSQRYANEHSHTNIECLLMRQKIRM